jgi:GGDEF domain-containing protein
LAECFQRWQSEAVPSALILLRLDRYRRIRGSMGHAIAEELSGCVEELLRGSLRDGNALYPTVHGEFAVVLPGVDAGEASRIADGFVGAVARQWGRQGFDGLRVTVRAGVSEFSVLDRGVGDIRERAAAALSQSRKESGAS